MVRARIAGLSLAVAAAGCGSDAMRARMDLPLDTRRLDNGLEVVMLPDHHAPTVAVRMRYHVGSKDEAPREQGLAHWLEHLTYARSAHTGEDSYFAEMVALGATQINGATGYDTTDYYFTVPSTQLEPALWFE